MPFTPSHAALALPFLRAPLIPSAVVIGTIGPDLPYFLPFPTFRDETHALWGVPTIDLVIGLVTWMLWIIVLRAPLVDLAPGWIRHRMPPPPALPWRGQNRARRLALLVVAILLGTITHLLWDAPTHPGWLADHVEVLRVPLGALPLTSWLHYASSVAGIVALAMWVRLWVVRTPRAEGEGCVGRGIRHLSLVAALAGFAIGGLVTWTIGIASGHPPFEGFLVFRVARVSIGAMLGVTALVCLWWIYRERRTATTLPRTSA